MLNSELEQMWMWSECNLRYYFGVLLEGLRKTIEDFSEGSWILS